jgi:hypothetical protein
MAFFRFDKENPDKFVATAKMPIVPDWQCDPLVWTPRLEEFKTRRVYVLCSQNSKGRDVFRMYPLLRKDDRYPAFVIVDNDDEWIDDHTTHIVFQHKNFSVIRPLVSVYYQAKSALKRRDLDYLPVNILTLIKHCYFKDIVDDSFIDDIQGQFEKLEKVLALAGGSNWEGESEVSYRMAIVICEKILRKVSVSAEIDDMIERYGSGDEDK